jgi:hypothetical protein
MGRKGFSPGVLVRFTGLCNKFCGLATRHKKAATGQGGGKIQRKELPYVV